MKTMDSVFSQTYKNVEYIIIDGGSSDGSFEVLKSRAGDLAYWISESDSGIYDAMNKGIKAAKGAYLLFLNSGDVFAGPQVLSDLFGSLNTKAEIIYGDYMQKKGKTLYRVNNPDQLNFQFFFFGRICHQAMLIRKCVFEKVGYYDTRYSLAADWVHFVSAIEDFKCTYQHVAVPVVVYDLDGVSSSRKGEEKIFQQRCDFFREHFPEHYEVYMTVLNYNLNPNHRLLQNISTNKLLSKVTTIFLSSMNLLLKKQ